jgi:hypothetical protein
MILDTWQPCSIVLFRSYDSTGDAPHVNSYAMNMLGVIDELGFSVMGNKVFWGVFTFIQVSRAYLLQNIVLLRI